MQTTEFNDYSTNFGGNWCCSFANLWCEVLSTNIWHCWAYEMRVLAFRCRYNFNTSTITVCLDASPNLSSLRFCATLSLLKSENGGGGNTSLLMIRCWVITLDNCHTQYLFIYFASWLNHRFMNCIFIFISSSITAKVYTESNNKKSGENSTLRECKLKKLLLEIFVPSWLPDVLIK